MWAELKQFIKEEIRNVLNENQFKASDTVRGKKIELVIMMPIPNRNYLYVFEHRFSPGKIR